MSLNDGLVAQGATADLGIADAIARGYPPSVLYLRNDEVVETEVCAFNYFSTFSKDFPEAEAHVWLFDGAGVQVGYYRKDLGLNGQLQLKTSRVCPNVSGTVAVTLLPKGDAKIRSGKRVTTGYYAQYFSQQGAVALSHEREPVTATTFPLPAWAQTYLTKFIEHSGVIVVNSCLAADGVASGNARLVALNGAVLAEQRLPAIPPMGGRRLATLELFPEAKQLVGSAESFALEVSGENMASPFSYYQFANGKFSLHHF
ncbi:hypothetical protein JQ604_33020 [Bradyrhizobium jicamae]|nr:hypothetical protein [Bradyrhizobium jicamae]